MLERIFTSKTRIRLLELFLFNPDKDYYLREIAKKIDITPIYVKKELENLEGFGLVKKERRGKIILFSTNRESPVFEDLKRIFIKTESLGKYLMENIKKIGEIKYALIFGSFASGEEREGSDIDMLIVGDVNEENLIKIIKRIEDKVSRDVNYILWRKKEFIKRIKEKHHLLRNIINSPVIWLMGDRDEFRKIARG